MNTIPNTRREELALLMNDMPAYRLRQVEQALLAGPAREWSTVTALPKHLRALMTERVPWLSVHPIAVRQSAAGDAYKALLETSDRLRIEAVLMVNAREHWTICVSSQVGCAMRCSFCATGTLGLTRSLSVDEIVDQYRFWREFLHDKDPQALITNIVYMGMGEPLANYENVKASLKLILTYTNIGPTRITVSTVGLLPQLNALLEDKEWPPVRLAISLHDADPLKRAAIVPSTKANFHADLSSWCQRYMSTLGNRRHYLTFEYALLSDVNDSDADAKKLGRFAVRSNVKKVNVIPWNTVPGTPFSASTRERIDSFKKIVGSFGVDVTERSSRGSDIAAACGQLALRS